MIKIWGRSEPRIWGNFDMNFLPASGNDSGQDMDMLVLDLMLSALMRWKLELGHVSIVV